MNSKSLKIYQNVGRWSGVRGVEASIYVEIIWKNLEFLEKALYHFKKASIPLKSTSKCLVVFKKASDYVLKPPFLWKCLQKASKLLKNSSKLLEKASIYLEIIEKSL
jgi:hypothetical protein